jgi:uncharacterized membrane protein (Fun14 family)
MRKVETEIAFVKLGITLPKCRIAGFLVGFALKRIMKMLAVIAGVFLLHLCIWSCVASILHQYFAGEYNNGKSLDIFDAKQKIIFKIPFL